MNTSEVRAELSVRMLELERAIDLGLAYTELKRIYSEIKELQLQIILADAHSHKTITSKTNDFVIV